MPNNDTTTSPQQHVGSTAELGGLPEPVGFRSRYRSEPGMIGHYPWTYADHRRRKYDRPECEYEDLFTAEQVRAAVSAERERWQEVVFDGWCVLQGLDEHARKRTSHQNVSDTLDALVRVMKPNTTDDRPQVRSI